MSFEQQIILGVDPGLASTGVGVIRHLGGDRWEALHSSHVTTARTLAMPARLALIHRLVEDCIDRHQPHALAIESIFFAKNVRSAVLMAHGRGAAILAAAQRKVPIFEYSPLEIKQSVVGKGHATKDQVKGMVTMLLSLAVAPKSDHAADALAAALCHAYRAGVSSKEDSAPGTGAESHEVEERRQLLALSMTRRRKRR